MSREQKATRLEKLQFLAQHSQLLDAPPGEIVKALKSAGLIAQSTYAADVHTETLVREARFMLEEMQKEEGGQT